MATSYSSSAKITALSSARSHLVPPTWLETAGSMSMPVHRHQLRGGPCSQHAAHGAGHVMQLSPRLGAQGVYGRWLHRQQLRPEHSTSGRQRMQTATRSSSNNTQGSTGGSADEMGWADRRAATPPPEQWTTSAESIEVEDSDEDAQEQQQQQQQRTTGASDPASETGLPPHRTQAAARALSMGGGAGPSPWPSQHSLNDEDSSSSSVDQAPVQPPNTKGSSRGSGGKRPLATPARIQPIPRLPALPKLHEIQHGIQKSLPHFEELGPEAQRHNITEILRGSYRSVIAFIAVGALMVCGLLFWVSGRTFRKANPYTFNITFSVAEGMRPGVPLRLKGVRVGTVKEVAVTLHEVTALVEVNSADTRIPAIEGTRYEYNRTGMLNPEPWIDCTPPDSTLKPELVPLLQRRGGREIAVLAFQHKGGAASSSNVTISPRRETGTSAAQSEKSDAWEEAEEEQAEEEQQHAHGAHVLRHGEQHGEQKDAHHPPHDTHAHGFGVEDGSSSLSSSRARADQERSDARRATAQRLQASADDLIRTLEGKQPGAGHHTHPSHSQHSHVHQEGDMEWTSTAAVAAAGGSSQRQGKAGSTGQGAADGGAGAAKGSESQQDGDLAWLMSTCAGPRAGEACRNHGLLVCEGDTVEGTLGGSSDEMARRMVVANRGPGKAQDQPWFR